MGVVMRSFARFDAPLLRAAGTQTTYALKLFLYPIHEPLHFSGWRVCRLQAQITPARTVVLFTSSRFLHARSPNSLAFFASAIARPPQNSNVISIPPKSFLLFDLLQLHIDAIPVLGNSWRVTLRIMYVQRTAHSASEALDRLSDT